jgi:large subunit ribosomal protein L32
MAVPKKRTGHSAQGHRRSNWKATKPETTKCSNCGELVLTHTVCTACGYYKGKATSIKSPDYVETKIEAKKPAKKVAKKTETAAKAKKAEVKTEVIAEEVVEETAVEEIKAEEPTEKIEE